MAKLKLDLQEFSKKIIVIFTLIYIAGAIFGGYITFVYHEHLGELLTYLSLPMTAGLVGYFCKAGFENVKKIKNSINERGDI